MTYPILICPVQGCGRKQSATSSGLVCAAGHGMKGDGELFTAPVDWNDHPETSFELEVPVANFAKVIAEKIVKGQFAGRLKLMVDKSSALLTYEQAHALARKLIALSGHTKQG